MPETIQNVHVVFKTHLDMGFTDFARNVVEKYFTRYIPQALDTAELLRREGGEDRFTWTTGSWLIYEYLEQASAADRQRMQEAIQSGDIAWHAYPFTSYDELMDPSLFRFGLSLSGRLDRRFGRQTIAAKITDVPGTTRAVLHILNEAGVQFLHIGVNPGAPLPEIPSPCVWRDPQGGEVVLLYQADYGAVYNFPGAVDALAFEFTNDNMGPQSPEEVRKIFRDLRARFPGARVAASTLDAYARTLVELKDQLPVVTGEIGCTWVHGTGTDPYKMSTYRTLTRLRSKWLEQGLGSDEDPVFQGISRFLLMVPEHTWGLDEKHHLDFDHYNMDQLADVRETQPYLDMEESWQEQRLYLQSALEKIGDLNNAAQLGPELEAALSDAEPAYPELVGLSPVEPGLMFNTPFFEVSFDRKTGAICHLVEKATGLAWAAPDHPLGLLRHQSFSAADFDRFLKQYTRSDEYWVAIDYGKPKLEAAGAVSAWRSPVLTGMWSREKPSGVRFLSRMILPELHGSEYGLPQEVTLGITFPSKAPEIHWDLQWFGKEAVRLPEAFWFSFNPLGCDLPSGWELDKAERRISPLDVVSKGSRSLHAVQRGVFYNAADRKAGLESLDAQLVAPGEPAMVDFTNRLPDLSGGMHFNLFNSIWGTNHPTWYEEDARFRFIFRTGAA